MGSSITSSRDHAHATGRCILRQPIKVHIPCEAPATFYATFHDTYGGNPAILQNDVLPDRDTKLITSIYHDNEQTQLSLRVVFLCI